MLMNAEAAYATGPMGDDGVVMTTWQIWLRRLCLFVVGWAAVELVLGTGLWGIYLLGLPVFGEGGLTGAAVDVGVIAMVGALLNLIIGALGVRGAKNPRKITLFFWITFIDAMLTAWALASSVSSGSCDLTSLVSGLFVIALAVCAWQVRGQTGYFDVHP